MIDRPPGVSVYHAALRYDAAYAREGMQGQRFVTLVDGRPTGNAPGSPLSQLGIVMPTGKVSTPHVHDDVYVSVHLLDAGPQGVLTLWGDELEHEAWLHAGETLWIEPTVPHVAIYPRYVDLRFDDRDVVDAPTALALETRSTPDPTHDVRPLPDLWPFVGRRLADLDLVTHVELPPPLVAWATTRTEDR